jgi:excisionase family DNA binding protein
MVMTDREPHTVMTLVEVSEFLKLAESTVYRLARTNKLPARKVGGVWRFSREALEEWIANKPAARKVSQE